MDYAMCREFLSWWQGVAIAEGFLILAIGAYWAGRRYGPDWDILPNLLIVGSTLILIFMGVMAFFLDWTSAMMEVLIYVMMIGTPAFALFAIFMWGAFHRHHPKARPSDILKEGRK